MVLIKYTNPQVQKVILAFAIEYSSRKQLLLNYNKELMILESVVNSEAKMFDMSADFR